MSDPFSDAIAEAIQPSIVDVFTPLGYTPTPKQILFHARSQEPVYGILFGGARGGGKTAALLMEAIHCAVNYPGIRILCLRRSYPELEESFIAELAKRNFAGALKARWNQTDHRLRFPNGSLINFAYAATEQDASHFLGGEYQLICIDEASRTLPAIIKHVEENLRSGSRAVPVLGLRLACVDEGDVLTAAGWKPIQDVTVGEEVYSTDPAGVMELKPVLDTFAGHCDDPLVRVRSRGLYMSMTQDHRVVYQDESHPRSVLDASARVRSIDPTYRIIPWDQHTKRTISVARSPLSLVADGNIDSPLGWATDTYLAFMGIFLAEGCTNSQPRRSNYKVIVTQQKAETQDLVRDLFDALPYRYSLSANGDFQITNKALWGHLRQFGRSHEKFVPRDILNHATPAQLRILLDWMILGDGHERPNQNGSMGIAYVTVSPQLADDVCEIGVKLGYRVNVRKTVLGHPNHNDRYDVSLVAGILPTTRVQKNSFIDHTTLEPFSGQVYCIKVADNENFVLRQHGTVWLSGNTNPGGTGGSYLKHRFILPTNKGRDLAQDDEGHGLCYIQSLYTDNPHLDQGYEAVLNAIDDPARRAMMRDGDWDAQVGAFFEQFNNNLHSVPAYELPKEWQRYAGIDYGTHAPCAVCWAALDNDGRLWVYRELYAKGMDASTQARTILDYEERDGDTDIVRLADPSMWGDNGTTFSIADRYGLEGCGIVKANNNRPSGWARVHWFLNEGAPCVYHADKGLKSCPMLHVFGDECPEFVRTIAEVPRSSLNPDDVDTKSEDHMPDALRYMCLYVGGGGRPIFYDEEQTAAARARALPSRIEDEIAVAAAIQGSAPMGLVGGRFAGSLGLSSR